MQNPDSYQDSLTQAEDACAARVFAVLDLQPGRTGVVGIANGLPDSAVFDIGELGDGATTGFDAVGHYFTGSLVMYNRDRHVLQTWIMRLIKAFPVNADYSADDQLREDTNVCVLRIRPVAGAVDVPGGDIWGALLVVEGQAHVGTAAATAQQLARVVGVKALVGAVALVVGPPCRLHARRRAVQCQAQAVDDGGFARARVARNQEEALLAQGRCVKVNLSLLNRRDIADM